MPFITASPYFKYYYNIGPAPAEYGSLFMRGIGYNGQMADSSITNWLFTTAPTKVLPDFKFGTLSIAGDGSSVYGITENGTLYAWGKNNEGQLGTNDTISRSAAVQIGSSGWVAVTAATNYTYAIDINNKLFAWGRNDRGQLGDNSTIRKLSPVQIGNDSWTMISARGVGIKADKSLWAWGDNYFGTLGKNDTITRSSPVQVGAATNWTKVTGTGNHVAAINEQGVLYTWGKNESGQLGNSSTISSSSPQQIGSMTWSDISADGLKTIGISSGKLYVSGRYPSDTTIYSWTMLAVGTDFALGVRSNGTLWAWGGNGYGQLGTGDTITRSSPVQIGTSSWSMVAAGDSFSVGLRADGKLFTWGSGSDYQLGSGNTISKSSPTQVGTSNWSMIAAGASAGFAIRSGGSLFAWGGQQYGVLGLPGLRDFASARSPSQIGTSNWSFISAGLSNTAAIRSDGKLFMWGGNGSGQLGINSGVILGRSSPTQVGTNNWISVSVGNNHISAIRSDSKLFAWGGNSYGQLGLSDTINKSSPVQIGTSNWSSISAGEQVTYATLNGTLYAWGNMNNVDAKVRFLGYRSSPVQISTGVSKVYTRSYNATNLYSYRYFYTTTAGIAVRNDPNGYGIEPVGLIYDLRSSMTQIGTGSNWGRVIGTGYGAYIFTTAGALYRWGTTPDVMLTGAVPATSPTLLGISNPYQISSSDNSGDYGYNTSTPLYGYVQK